jgi:hypothetical protein
MQSVHDKGGMAGWPIRRLTGTVVAGYSLNENDYHYSYDKMLQLRVNPWLSKKIDDRAHRNHEHPGQIVSGRASFKSPNASATLSASSRIVSPCKRQT